MKKNSVFILIIGMSLALLAAGCGLSGMQSPPGAESTPASRSVAQHPAVYEVRVTENNATVSLNPCVVWTGSEYGVAWCENFKAICFARLNKNGAKIGQTIQISDTTDVRNAMYPCLAWTGDGYGVVWQDCRSAPQYVKTIRFIRLSPEGVKSKEGEKLIAEVDHDENNPSLVWNGNKNEFGLGLMDRRDYKGNWEVYFYRLKPNGDVIVQNQVSLSDGYASRGPSVVWTGREYGVAWTDYGDVTPEIYFARIDWEGVPIPVDGNNWIIPISVIDGFSSINPRAGWMGNGYGVVWEEHKDEGSDIYYAQIGRDGKVLARKRISKNDDYQSFSPSLMRNGVEFGVAWTDMKLGANEIYFARIDWDGSILDKRRLVTSDDGNASEFPSLTSTGRGFAVAWQDSRKRAKGDIYFARLDASGKTLAQGGLTGAITGTMSGTYYIRNVVYETYLTDNGGSNVALAEYDSSAPNTQQWELTDIDNDGHFQIVNKNSRKSINGKFSSYGVLGETLGLISYGCDMPSLYYWWLYPYDDEGSYMLRIEYDVAYRIYATGETTVKLKSNSNFGDPKKWQLMPAEN
jgi:hypothetical protein